MVTQRFLAATPSHGGDMTTRAPSKPVKPSKRAAPLIIGIPVYQGVDLLDVAAPVEVFAWLADAWQATRDVRIYVLAETNGSVMTRAGLPIVPHKTFDAVKH